MDAEHQLLIIIKNELSGTFQELSDVDWPKLVYYAKKQGLLIYLSLYANKMRRPDEPPEELRKALRKTYSSELACHSHQVYALEEMQDALETAGVDSLALKGSVTKNRYPNPLLRPMGDIDILYRPEQQDQFRTVVDTLFYDSRSEGRKHDTYRKRPFVIVEAHRQLVAASSPYHSYCANAWNRAVLKQDHRYTYEMTLEDEFIFNIIHFASHMVNGSAGIRFVNDIHIYNSLPMERDYLCQELNALGLLKFYQTVSELARYWFEGMETSNTARRLGEYILSDNLFGGTEEQNVLPVNSGRLRFLLSSCFPSYPEMVSMFPWLKGRHIILPFAWALRAVKSVLYRRKNIIATVQKTLSSSATRGRELRVLCRECGLQF